MMASWARDQKRRRWLAFIALLALFGQNTWSLAVMNEHALQSIPAPSVMESGKSADAHRDCAELQAPPVAPPDSPAVHSHHTCMSCAGCVCHPGGCVTILLNALAPPSLGNIVITSSFSSLGHTTRGYSLLYRPPIAR